MAATRNAIHPDIRVSNYAVPMMAAEANVYTHFGTNHDEVEAQMLVHVMQGHSPRWHNLPASFTNSVDYDDYVTARNRAIWLEETEVELINFDGDDRTCIEAHAHFAY